MGKRIFLAATWVVLSVGFIALVIRFTEGMKTTHLGSIVPWGLWVSLYIYFIGLSAGSFLISTLVYVFGLKQYEPIGRTAVLQALICLILGLFFIWLDLGQPWRAYKVFVSHNWSSVLEWEIHIYLLYITILLGELWLLMRCNLADLAVREKGLRRGMYKLLSLGWPCPANRAGWVTCHAQSMRWVKVLGIIGIPGAIGVHGGTGAIFAVVKARPYWYSSLFPIVFLVSALASGGALLLFLRAWFGDRRDQEEQGLLKSLANLTAGFLAVDLLMILSEFLVGLYGEIPEHTAVFRQIAAGPFWWVFWLVQLLFGAAVPLVIVMHSRLSASRMWLGLAGLLIAVGIFGVRLNIIIPALSFPVMPGLEETFSSARLSTFYFPSLNEWLTSAFGVGLGALLFYLGITYLPLEEREAA